MRKMKRGTSLLLSIVMVLGMVPVQGFAADCQHDLTYSAEGTCITAACGKEGCGYKETATLELDKEASLAYTGKEVKPLKVVYSDGWQDVTPEITYVNNIEVTKLQEAAAEPVNAEAPEEAQPVPEKTEPEGEAEPADNTQEQDPPAEKPEEPKIPTGKLTIGGVSVTKTFAIAEKEKLTVTATVSVSYGDDEPAYVLVYKNVDGTAVTPELSGEPEVTSAYSKEAKVGDEFVVDVNIDGVTSAQYELVLGDSGSFTVEQRELAIDWGTLEFSYSGEPQRPELKVTNIVPGEDVKVIETGTAQTAVGKYDIEITGLEGEHKDNYKLPAETKKQFEIKPLEVKIDWGTLEFEYDGNKHCPEPQITNRIGEEDVTLDLGDAEGETEAGTYTITVLGLNGADAGNYVLPEDPEAEYKITKPAREKPDTVGAVAETVLGKADGKITGVTEEMEYKARDAADYIEITGTEVFDLPAGTYLVRYKETEYNAASEDVEVTVDEGRYITVAPPEKEKQIGYTLSADKTEVAYGESVTITYELADGYTELETFAVKVNGEKVSLDENGSYTIQNITENVTVTVEGISVLLAISFDGKTFHTVAEDTAFDRYTNAKTLVITGISGGKLWYALKDKAVDDFAEITDWTEYTKALTFSNEASRKLIAYAKVTDAEGKAIAYASTYGVVLDHVAPVIKVNGVVPTGRPTYYTTQQVTVTDANPVKVMVENNEKTAPFLLAGNEDRDKCTIKAIDDAGNTISRTVTIQEISTLDDTISDLNGTNMTSAKKSTVEAVITNVNTILEEECANATKEEKAELEAIVDTCNGLLLVLDIQALPDASDVDPDDADTLEKFIEVVTTYEKLSDSGKNAVGNANEEILNDLGAALTDYEITTKAANLKWTLDSKKTLTVAVNGAYSMFDSLWINNVELDKGDDYTVKAGTSGGTSITIKAAYLQTLKAGKYKIQVKYQYGATDGEDQIQILSSGTNPKTGDEGILLWMTASVLSLACLAAAAICGRKRRYQA